MKTQMCKHEGCENPRAHHKTVCRPCDNLMQKYGITGPEKQQMIDDQNGLCKICESPVGVTGLAGSTAQGSACVDHCHKTGKIRGILCGPCNILLGKSFDSVDILQNAIRYLNDAKTI